MHILQNFSNIHIFSVKYKIMYLIVIKPKIPVLYKTKIKLFKKLLQHDQFVKSNQTNRLQNGVHPNKNTHDYIKAHEIYL